MSQMDNKAPRPDFEIKIKKVEGVNSKKFRTQGKDHYYICIYIDSKNPQDLNQIELVQYELHSSFKKRIRIADNLQDNFALKIWTYGFFPIKAKIICIDGTSYNVGGYVSWD